MSMIEVEDGFKYQLDKPETNSPDELQDPTMAGLTLEVQELIQTSIDLKKSIDAATTKTKKDYLTKKLHKNNRLVYKAVNIVEYLKQQSALMEAGLTSVDGVAEADFTEVVA